MRISDWSSDVCSSDLQAAEREYQAALQRDSNDIQAMSGLFNLYVAQNRTDAALALASRIDQTGTGSSLGPEDRKSVGSGKSVSGRVDLGGRRIIKKKRNTAAANHSNTSKTIKT